MGNGGTKETTPLASREYFAGTAVDGTQCDGLAHDDDIGNDMHQLSEPSEPKGQSIVNAIEVDGSDGEEKSNDLLQAESSGQSINHQKTCTDHNAEYCKHVEKECNKKQIMRETMP